MASEGREPRASASGRRRGSTGSSDDGSAAITNGSASAPGVARLMIDLDFVRGLIEAVDGSSIDTLEINRAGTRIRISKTPPPGPAPAGGTPIATVSGGVTSNPDAATPAQASGSGAPTTTQVEAPPSNLIEVRSPMVGTFYRAPAPEAPPYVEVGSHVTKGQTLCILEAMKLMNELESEVDGIVREVLVANADPVEYGQVLFRIEPT